LDALSDLLRIVRLTGAVFMDAEFTEPWCIGEPAGVEMCAGDMPDAQHVVIYHLVTEGRGAVREDLVFDEIQVNPELGRADFKPSR